MQSPLPALLGAPASLTEFTNEAITCVLSACSCSPSPHCHYTAYCRLLPATHLPGPQLRNFPPTPLWGCRHPLACSPLPVGSQPSLSPQEGWEGRQVSERGLGCLQTAGGQKWQGELQQWGKKQLLDLQKCLGLGLYLPVHGQAKQLTS